jgi:hypothetical protein
MNRKQIGFSTVSQKFQHVNSMRKNWDITKIVKFVPKYFENPSLKKGNLNQPNLPFQFEKFHNRLSFNYFK